MRSLRQRFVSGLIGIGLGGVTLSAAGLVINDDTPVVDYTSAATGPFAATGGLHINGNFESSGVLVAPNIVLGASHAAASATASGRSFVIGGSRYAVASVARLDGNNTATDGRDTALFTLSAPVAGIDPAAIYTGSLAATVGLTATYTGLGDQGTGSAPPTGDPADPDGVLLAGENIIESAGATFVDDDGMAVTFSNNILFADFDDGSSSTNKLGSITQLDREMGLALGDSGGGVFVFNAVAGRYELAALHSFILGEDFGYGQISASTGFAPADLATILAVIPEPTSAAVLLLLTGGLVSGRTRRGKKA